MEIPDKAVAILAMTLAMGSVYADLAQELAAWQQEQEQALLQNGSSALEQMSVQPRLNLVVQRVKPMKPVQLPGDSYVQGGVTSFVQGSSNNFSHFLSSVFQRLSRMLLLQ